MWFWGTPDQAHELQRPTAAPSKARPLSVEDLLSVDELRKKSLYEMAGQPEPDSKVKFVGQDARGTPWLESTYADIKDLIKKGDTPGRVSPAALIGCSRSGKTRALIELGEKLRIQGKNVIFVSFNEKTSFVEGESSSRLESLLARIAYAIAKDNAISGMSLHDYTTEPPTLRFTTQKKSVLDWLDENDCVLLMDEFNKCIKSGVDGAVGVVRFLRDNFASTTNRYYVFSTHVSSTTKVVRMLGNASEPSSDRSVHPIALPLVKNQGDWKDLTDCSGAHPAWFGLSPGLIRTARIEKDTLPQKWGDAFEDLRQNSRDEQEVYGAVLLDLFAPESADRAVVPQFEQFARTSTSVVSDDDESIESRRTWAPMALRFVLSKISRHLSRSAREPCEGVVELLDALKTTEIGAGKSWEIALACALILRVEVSRSRIPPATLKNSLRVKNTNFPDEEKVGIFPDGLAKCLDPDVPLTWSFPRPQQDLNDVLSSLEDHEPGSRPEARLLRPAKADFKTYDLLLAFYPRDGGCEISGYQRKTGKKMNVSEPEPGVRSFLVLGAAKDKAKKDSNAATSGWIVLTKAEIDAFMGPTLGPILEFEDALGDDESG